MTVYVFVCDYCREQKPIADARLGWDRAENLPSGETLVTVHVYCSPSCTRWARDGVGGSRG